jgi:flavodoxin II
MYKVGETSLSEAILYSNLIFGIPTWDYGELQEDWEENWSILDTLDLHNKKVALYGVGDQLGYPDWFLDAMGYLHDKIVLRGAQVVGYWPNSGYEFESSQALTPDKKYFVGLAIDEENQFDLSDERIARWVKELKIAFTL